MFKRRGQKSNMKSRRQVEPVIGSFQCYICGTLQQIPFLICFDFCNIIIAPKMSPKEPGPQKFLKIACSQQACPDLLPLSTSLSSPNIFQWSRTTISDTIFNSLQTVQDTAIEACCVTCCRGWVP